jgi:hypothetical protein
MSEGYAFLYQNTFAQDVNANQVQYSEYSGFSPSQTSNQLSGVNSTNNQSSPLQANDPTAPQGGFQASNTFMETDPETTHAAYLNSQALWANQSLISGYPDQFVAAERVNDFDPTFRLI